MLRRVFKKKPKIIEKSTDKVKTAVVHATGPVTRTQKSPDEVMGRFFDDVQRQQVYPDGKTFVDMVPRKRAKALAKEYQVERQDPDFNLHEFVNRHFYEIQLHKRHDYKPSDETTAREHITNLWPHLKRRNRKNRGSLVALPYEYIVPGGRFSEQFYWDTYFIMLGLAADGEWSLIQGMMRNYTYMLRKFGMIPTANRAYFLSRSQPPFFALMVKLLAKHRGRTWTYAEYLSSLLTEYRFWMRGRKIAGDRPDHAAYARVVRMPNGVILNRYYDNKTTPRPESRREDLETAELAKTDDKHKLFLDLRAGAESGWDFSSRWFREVDNIESIHTTDMVAVDLNCLLYIHEQTIAEAYTLIKQPILAKRFRQLAERRAEAVRRYCWKRQHGLFVDYDFRRGEASDRLTLATVFPLYAKIATAEQASAVAQCIKERFLRQGGLVTTLENNGQQWDSPNGWAPLQWIAIQGLREYGYHELADEIRRRWLATCDAVYLKSRKMVEKYDVVNADAGGGGEYPLQDGFGWTNGVYAALYDEKEPNHGR
ncbi:alpha,alpha-trehalase TreF [Candidatus Saccharibacteria bacterium oral taxon 955]|nr:alpha,alpha-trehalase TreF [Candidatus Saccharibacteria bacterium oral taxon 955]QJU06020.1 alpha,alpha-trehalase TreF [Candidatus Saccharibacteria bacterium oral taxon 955]